MPHYIQTQFFHEPLNLGSSLRYLSLPVSTKGMSPNIWADRMCRSIMIWEKNLLPELRCNVYQRDMTKITLETTLLNGRFFWHQRSQPGPQLEYPANNLHFDSYNSSFFNFNSYWFSRFSFQRCMPSLYYSV